jgi:signal transduction histidine kinase
VKDVGIGLRGRMTMLYGTLFLLAGSLVVGATYFFTVRAVNAKFHVSFTSTQLQPGTPLAPNRTFSAMQGDIDQQLAAHRREILGELLQISILALVILGVLTIVIGYLIAGRMLRPLHTVTATARRLSESNLHERIGLAGPRDEIKDLADTFDGMLDRLHRAFDSQRRFIANASHELRTPLTMTRTAIEVALARRDTPPETKALGHKLLIANDRHARLIDGLLTLARSERELRTHSSVDVAVLATHAIDQLGPDARNAGVDIKQVLHSGATTGNPVLLERSVVNLVENAIKYNVTAGKVWVRTGRLDGHVFVTVENTGPSVSPTDAEAIFEPFRRLRGSRVQSDRGAGLGLSIVQAVMQAHGGTVKTIPRTGGGLAITLRLPATAPPSDHRSRCPQTIRGRLCRM